MNKYQWNECKEKKGNKEILKYEKKTLLVLLW